jgi:hypothetical protein
MSMLNAGFATVPAREIVQEEHSAETEYARNLVGFDLARFAQSSKTVESTTMPAIVGKLSCWWTINEVSM